MSVMFRGSYTALITPFKDGEIDWQAFDNLIERQIESGTHGLVACGTTAESPTLNHAEHIAMIARCVAVTGGRVPVIAGTGSNATAEAVEMTKHAKTLKADAALIVTPYYNKPVQEGLYQHYKMIAESADIPIIIYNIPGRSVVDMSTETLAQLAALPNIIGVKDATGDLSRVTETTAACGADFCQLSGEDALIYDYLALGGHGCISVTSNIAPALCAALHDAWIAGDKAKAELIAKQLMPLHEALFTECSPQPAKYAAQRLGLCRDEMRLPLIPASKVARAAIDQALETCGLLSAEQKTALQAHG